MKCIVTDYSGRPMEWVEGERRFYIAEATSLIYRLIGFKYRIEKEYPSSATIFSSPKEALKYIKKSNKRMSEQNVDGGFSDFPYRIVLVQEFRNV